MHSRTFVDVQPESCRVKYCLVDAQMAGSNKSPAVTCQRSCASSLSAKENDSEQATQPTTPRSTIVKATSSRLPRSADPMTPPSASQSASSLLTIRVKGRKRTSSGSVKEWIQEHNAASEHEVSVEPRNDGIQVPSSDVLNADWPMPADSRSLSILTPETPRLTCSREVEVDRYTIPLVGTTRMSPHKHARQRSQLEWKNASKFEDLPQIR